MYYTRIQKKIIFQVVLMTFRSIGLVFFLMFSLSQVHAFDSFEHIWAGDSVLLHFYGEDQRYGHNYPYYDQTNDIYGMSNGLGHTYPKLVPVKLKVPAMTRKGEFADMNETTEMSFGEIVAIAGDFIADPNGIQISSATTEHKQVEEFTRVFRYLTKYKGNPFYRAKLDGGLIHAFRTDFRAEYQTLIDALSTKQDVKDYMLSLNTPYSKIMSTVSSGGFNKYPYYKVILGANLDHFGKDAFKTYRAGHLFAIELASRAHAAHQKHQDAEATAWLNAAYAAEAFADHYLTDLFSAGHIRTPRREMLVISKTVLAKLLPKDVEAGALANAMHDEDGFRGLNVARNLHQDKWRAFGDYTYFDNDSFENRMRLQETLQASADEVWQYATNEPNHSHSDFNILNYLPEPLPYPPNNRLPKKDTENYYPLVRKQGDDWMVRKSWYRPNEFNYLPIGQITFATAFTKGNQFTFPRDDFYHFLRSDHGKEGNKYEISIDCYHDRTYSISKNYKQPEKTAKAHFIKNSATGTKFAKEILVGFSPPSNKDQSYDSYRKFYIVDEETGCQFQAECNKLWNKEKPETLDIRAHDYWTKVSYPLALYDNDGIIHRVQGGPDKYKYDCPH